MPRVYVKPAGKGYFWVRREGRHRFHREIRSRQPMLAMARKLLAEGAHPGQFIEMWHDDASTWAVRATIAAAAKLTVGDRPSGNGPRFEPFTLSGLDRE